MLNIDNYDLQRTPKLDHILKDYADFESDVMALTAEFLLPWCANCQEVCCKVDYCRESLDSPFLSLLHSNSRPLTVYSDRNGWLTPSGCALAAGRPPVCYEFICNRILNDQPAVLFRYAIAILSKLISHVGKRAVGRRHLVEILDPSDLSAIHFGRFNQRMTEARQAFQAVKSILKNQPLPKGAGSVLSKIAQPPSRQIL